MSSIIWRAINNHCMRVFWSGPFRQAQFLFGFIEIHSLSVARSQRRALLLFDGWFCMGPFLSDKENVLEKSICPAPKNFFRPRY